MSAINFYLGYIEKPRFFKRAYMDIFLEETGSSI